MLKASSQTGPETADNPDGRTRAGTAEVRAEYERRLGRRQAEGGRWHRHSDRVATARLLVFLIALVLLWLVFREHRVTAWWLAAPAVVFGALMLIHEAVIRRQRRAEAAAAWYQDGLDRLDHRWVGRGPAGNGFLEPDHPYASDLDIFGEGSLFQLLCRARTAEGQRTLAAWLLAPAAADELPLRQAAVRELAPQLDLREDLAVLGTEGPALLQPQRLDRWQQAPAMLASRRTRSLAVALTVFCLLSAAAWAAGFTGATPFLAVLVLQGAYRLSVRPQLRRVVGVWEIAERELPLLTGLLGRLEREQFSGAHLRALRHHLDTEEMLPSVRLRQLTRLQDCFEARRNALFAPVTIPLLWEIHFAAALETWRVRHGAAVVRWLRVIGEFEALASLAGAAFERPDDVYPQLVNAGPLFDGAGIGHPLLPEATCVRNDLRLGPPHDLQIVSGSNMSGKSTWLRCVGILCVLAYAGAPVRARSLRLSRLALGTSIRVQDSLQSGVSHFAAEVRRLRRMADLAEGSEALLYLIDELLQGTNSHDRRVGAEAVLRSLRSRGAIGVITTHDLALTDLAAALGPGAANVHFQDQWVDGRMVFDYRIHPGVITRSNALDLMRAAGLEV